MSENNGSTCFGTYAWCLYEERSSSNPRPWYYFNCQLSEEVWYNFSKKQKKLSDRIVLVHSTREIVLPQDEKKSKKIFCFPLYIQTSPSMIFMDAHPDIYFNVWYVLILWTHLNLRSFIALASCHIEHLILKRLDAKCEHFFVKKKFDI